jgi:HlyD family secretion protein
VCPVRFHLGEQAEILIQVAVLEKATLVPETAVAGYDGNKGTVWIVEDGRLARRAVNFGHRTQDSRLQIVSGLPDSAQVVTRINAGLQEGRAARAEVEGKR